jgi:hypothetical protein
VRRTQARKSNATVAFAESANSGKESANSSKIKDRQLVRQWGRRSAAGLSSQTCVVWEKEWA